VDQEGWTVLSLCMQAISTASICMSVIGLIGVATLQSQPLKISWTNIVTHRIDIGSHSPIWPLHHRAIDQHLENVLEQGVNWFSLLCEWMIQMIISSMQSLSQMRITCAQNQTFDEIWDCIGHRLDFLFLAIFWSPVKVFVVNLVYT